MNRLALVAASTAAPVSVVAIALALLTAGCAQEQALTASPASAVELRGRVEPSMMKTVRAALDRGQRDFEIDSPGGGVVTAILIAGVIEQAGGSLTVVGPCQSACSLMLMGVKRRYIAPGGFVEMHASNGGGLSSVYRSFGIPQDVAARGDGFHLHRLTHQELAEAGIARR